MGVFLIDTTVDDIRSFIIESFLFGDRGRLEDDTPLLERHIVDSTGVLEIVAFLEDRYGIRIEDQELIPDNLNSVNNISKFVEAKKPSEKTADRGASLRPSRACGREPANG